MGVITQSHGTQPTGTPPPLPARAQLYRRIRELEERIAQLEAERIGPEVDAIVIINLDDHCRDWSGID